MSGFSRSLVVEADRLQHRARRRAVGAVGERGAVPLRRVRRPVVRIGHGATTSRATTPVAAAASTVTVASSNLRSSASRTPAASAAADPRDRRRARAGQRHGADAAGRVGLQRCKERRLGRPVGLVQDVGRRAGRRARRHPSRAPRRAAPRGRRRPRPSRARRSRAARRGAPPCGRGSPGSPRPRPAAPRPRAGAPAARLARPRSGRRRPRTRRRGCRRARRARRPRPAARPARAACRPGSTPPRTRRRSPRRSSRARARAGSGYEPKAVAARVREPARTPARRDWTDRAPARRHPPPRPARANSPGSTSSSFQRSRASADAVEAGPEVRGRRRCTHADGHERPRVDRGVRGFEHRVELGGARAGEARLRRRRRLLQPAAGEDADDGRPRGRARALRSAARPAALDGSQKTPSRRARSHQAARISSSDEGHDLGVRDSATSAAWTGSPMRIAVATVVCRSRGLAGDDARRHRPRPRSPSGRRRVLPPPP